MPLTWVEDNESRSASIVKLGKKAQSSYVKSYKIFGTTDDVVVHAEVNTKASTTLQYWQYPGQPLNKLWADSYTLEYLGDDAWQVKITYIKEGAEDDQQQNPLKRTRSFDTSGGTAHKTQAESETRYPSSGGSAAPDMKKAIGVDGDSVAGVDVVVPAFKWTETYDVPHQYVTDNYIRTLCKLTGTVNQGTFRGFPAGEVLFLGATGSHEWDDQKGSGPWSLTYNFAQSSNAGSGETFPAIEIGGITNIAKKGHEYLWVRYEAAVEGNDYLKRPKHVYVNKVYRDGDFSQLGIG